MDIIKLNFNQGFTMLELVSVIVIVGILAAIAIPQYANYAPHMFVQNGLNETEKLQKEVESFYEKNQRFPTEEQLDRQLFDAAGSVYLSKIGLLGSGNIQITYRERERDFLENLSEDPLVGRTILLTPEVSQGKMIWSYCRDGTVSVIYRPYSCRRK